MTKKMLEDCAACPIVSLRDAHTSSDPGWKHLAGVDPCRVITGEPE